MPPRVSVVMPVRNEAQYIEENVSRLIGQDYPSDAMEVIVADGMSDDGTRELLRELRGKHSSIHVIDNPDRIVPTGLNAAIRQATGDIVVRIDGHVLIEPDFIAESVAALQKCPDAWAVGGPIVHVASTTFGKAVAVAMSHRLGVGNASHRLPTYEGYGEGTAFPAMYRWVFDKVGFYDEALVRNQDDEFYFRINQAGGKFFITPKIRYQYFVRESVRQLFRQYYQYSFWRIPVISKHRQPTTVRQLIPSAFYIAMAIFFALGLLLGSPWLALGLPTIYLLALCGVGFSQIRSHGLPVACLVPLAIATMHSAYAWGMIYGGVHALVGSDPWQTSGKARALSR